MCGQGVQTEHRHTDLPRVVAEKRARLRASVQRGMAPDETEKKWSLSPQLPSSSQVLPGLRQALYLPPTFIPSSVNPILQPRKQTQNGAGT